MATVTITTGKAPARTRGVRLTGRLGLTVDLPFAPTTGELDGWPRKWGQLPRAGRSDVLVDGGDGLDTVSYPLVVAYPDGRSIDAVLSRLRTLVQQENDGVTISGLGLLESNILGPWRITGCPVSIKQRRPDQHVQRAEITLQLTAVSDVQTKVGKSKKPAKKKAS